MSRICVRAGVFRTHEGGRLLDALLDRRYGDVNSKDLATISVTLGSNPPSKERLISLLRAMQDETEPLDFEVRVMDRVRDAFGACVRRGERERKKSTRAKTVILEYTDAGSTFSRAT